MIILSAIKTDNMIFVGKRHSNIILQNLNINFKHCIQGFFTDNCKFLDRKEAAKYAYKIGQTAKEHSVLLSEDLW